MAVEGISQSGGAAQVEENKRKSHTEGTEKARNEALEEKAQVRKERAFNEVDESA